MAGIFMNKHDTAPEPTRPLGPQEALFGELNLRCNGAIQLMAIVELEHARTVERVLDALQVAHACHPMMRARMVDRSGTWWWATDVAWGDIDVTIVPVESPFEFEAAYTSIAAVRLDLQAETYRVVLHCDTNDKVTHMSFIVNHAALDARGLVIALDTFDAALNGASPSPRAQTSAPIAVEIGLAAAGYTGDQSILPPPRDDTLFSVTKAAVASERRPRAFFRDFPVADMARLHTVLKARELPVGSALVEVAGETAATLEGHADGISLLVTTDCRNDCKPSMAGIVGQFVASITVERPGRRSGLGGKPLIESIKDMHDMMVQRRPAALALAEKYDPDATRASADQIAQPNRLFASGICVSSIGNLDSLCGRHVGISRMMLMPLQNHGIHPIMIVSTTTASGSGFTFGFDEPLRTRESAHAYADRFMNTLLELSATKNEVED
jgi:hypothetical protein